MISELTVNPDKFSSFLASIKVPLNHPLFFPRVFALISRLGQIQRKGREETIEGIIAEEYEEFSRRLDRSQIQESCSVRNILRSRRLAHVLIDEKGDLNPVALHQAIAYLKRYFCSLGSYRQYDIKRQQHMLKVLETLEQNKETVRLLKRISRPYGNKHVEDLIRQTLQLPSTISITDIHARQAVLASWLAYLRQNVGSCFATAPAKIVHDEQPELFLQDMANLLATGRLSRTFGGVEYSVPLSMTWGPGDLKKPLLVRFSDQSIQPEIWYSPGLIAAFDSVHLFSPNQSLKEKTNHLQEWIIALIKQKALLQPFVTITGEEIIRFALLQALGLTEQNINDFESQPHSLIQTQLFMPMPTHSRQAGGLGKRCENFLHQFEIAKNTFKALSDHALLKAWEFTLASFGETKLEFTRWNLYSSLGMGTNEPGGIGQCIYQTVQQKLEFVNKTIDHIRPEYEMVYTQVKTLEGRIRQASTEKEAQWLKVEYQSRTNEFYFLEEQMRGAQLQAKNLVGLSESLYNIYLDLFKDYFQEIYDADVQDIITGPFDDSPAGFRLVYKHGRSNTSQWTRIQNPTEFIDALVSFFVSTEPRVAAILELKEQEKDLSEIITAIINHIKTNEFLESAFHRMAAIHGVPPIANPLDNLEKVEKKPWVYVSGGTMNTLVSTYYRLEDKPKEENKWVESEMELLVFLVDTLKRIPPYALEPYLKRKRDGILMQSPTHAFILKPNSPLLKEAWNNEEFTYTFVRDRFVRPFEFFVEKLILNDEMIQTLVLLLAEKIPENFRPQFKAMTSQLKGPLNPIFFREYVSDLLANDRGLRMGHFAILADEEIDSTLFSALPLFPLNALKDRIHKILTLLPGLSLEKIEEIVKLIDQIPVVHERSMVTAHQLQDICKALLCLANLQTSSMYDYHLAISQAAQKLGFAMPTPFIFADTNWVKEEFGFIISPGTGRLELWRLDYTGSFGYPMTIWKQWLDGSHTHPTWGVYIKPFEYGQN